jgi:hypothetical protein
MAKIRAVVFGVDIVQSGAFLPTFLWNADDPQENTTNLRCYSLYVNPLSNFDIQTQWKSEVLLEQTRYVNGVYILNQERLKCGAFVATATTWNYRMSPINRVGQVTPTGKKLRPDGWILWLKDERILK